MPGRVKLAKARMVELDAGFKRPLPSGKSFTVQFNPETLKVTFSNELEQPGGGGDQRGSPARQFIGKSTTTLALSLVFDVGAPQPPGKPVDDVRKLTQQVAYFMTPKERNRRKAPFPPPAVRFLWGSFQFDGLVGSMEETLEYFSPEGKPLRATVALSLTRQEFQFAFADTKTPPTPGTQPLAVAQSGSTVQGLADRAGKADWRPIAAANGIENPRRLVPGQRLNLNAAAPPRIGRGL
jgi:hypothetical protein